MQFPQWMISNCLPTLAACSLISIFIQMLLSPPLKNTLLLIPACSFPSRFTICHKTEVVKNTLNPVWQPFTIPVRALCNGDYDRYCSDSPCSSHLLITTAAVHPFIAVFGCFSDASPAFSPALKDTHIYNTVSWWATWWVFTEFTKHTSLHQL